MIRISVSLVAALAAVASPLLADTIPSDAQGSWDVSEEECDRPGTSVTQIDITADRIDTYGGNAQVTEVVQTGPVTYVAAAFQQTEGVPELGPREPAYMRLTQRDGPDRLNLIWKDVQTVDLVRCGGAVQDAQPASAAPLPLPTGLWVMAGEDCANPANAGWRVFDGKGIRGARSRSCEIDATSQNGDRYDITQTCVASYDGSAATYRDTVVIEALKRFGLIEDGESTMQDFNWCGPRLDP